MSNMHFFEVEDSDFYEQVEPEYAEWCLCKIYAMDLDTQDPTRSDYWIPLREIIADLETLLAKKGPTS